MVGVFAASSLYRCQGELKCFIRTALGTEHRYTYKICEIAESQLGLNAKPGAAIGYAVCTELVAAVAALKINPSLQVNAFFGVMFVAANL